MEMDAGRAIIVILAMLIPWLHDTEELIGYDYTALTNITTLSLLNIEECDIPQQAINSTKVYNCYK